MLPAPALALAGPPLEPGPDEARALLEAELSRPGYGGEPSLLTRLARWLQSLLPDGGPSVGAPSVGVVLVVAVLLLLLALLVWRLRDARQVVAERRRRERGLTEPGRSAADYRREAREHLDAGAVDRAVVAAFRAVVVDLDDADVVRDAPGRTAHEVAEAAATARPQLADDVRGAALTFDAACYGHPDGPLPGPHEPQRTTADDARRVLALDLREATAW